MVSSAPNNMQCNPWPDMGNEGEGYPRSIVVIWVNFFSN